MARADFDSLSPFDGDHLQVVIETPRGSRNKYKYDERRRLMELSGVLPAGSVFPFDFGFVPSTVGGDGDPLDVLVLMDEPAFPGCLVAARIIGAIRAKQKEAGKTARNDRLVAAAAASRNHSDVKRLRDLNGNLLHEIEHFFVSYNEVKGKEFRIIGHDDAEEGRKLVDEAHRRYSERQRSPARGQSRP